MNTGTNLIARTSKNPYLYGRPALESAEDNSDGVVVDTNKEDNKTMHTNLPAINIPASTPPEVIEKKEYPKITSPDFSNIIWNKNRVKENVKMLFFAIILPNSKVENITKIENRNIIFTSLIAMAVTE
ncbi:MAG: hypothetical protein QXT63_00210 [Thermoplasmata archaeon]